MFGTPSESLAITNAVRFPLFENRETWGTRLADKLTESGRPNEGFVPGGFSLWARDWDQPSAPPQYRFEIKAGSSPGENRYYTAAPLTTDMHLALLEEQERLLS